MKTPDLGRFEPFEVHPRPSTATSSHTRSRAAGATTSKDKDTMGQATEMSVEARVRAGLDAAQEALKVVLYNDAAITTQKDLYRLRTEVYYEITSVQRGVGPAEMYMTATCRRSV